MNISARGSRAAATLTRAFFRSPTFSHPDSDLRLLLLLLFLLLLFVLLLLLLWLFGLLLLFWSSCLGTSPAPLAKLPKALGRPLRDGHSLKIDPRCRCLWKKTLASGEEGPKEYQLERHQVRRRRAVSVFYSFIFLFTDAGRCDPAVACRRQAVANNPGWAATFTPKSMPKTDRITYLYSKTVRLEVCTQYITIVYFLIDLARIPTNSQNSD